MAKIVFQNNSSDDTTLTYPDHKEVPFKQGQTLSLTETGLYRVGGGPDVEPLVTVFFAGSKSLVASISGPREPKYIGFTNGSDEDIIVYDRGASIQLQPGQIRQFHEPGPYKVTAGNAFVTDVEFLGFINIDIIVAN